MQRDCDRISRQRKITQNGQILMDEHAQLWTALRRYRVYWLIGYSHSFLTVSCVQVERDVSLPSRPQIFHSNFPIFSHLFSHAQEADTSSHGRQSSHQQATQVCGRRRVLRRAQRVLHARARQRGILRLRGQSHTCKDRGHYSGHTHSGAFCFLPGFSIRHLFTW